MSALRQFAWGTALLLGLGGPAWAADLTPEPVPLDSGWEFSLTPYFWAAGLKGDVAEFGLPEVEVDLSFSDIIKNFDIGVMAVGEARNGNFGVVTDVLYLKVSADDDVNAGPIDANIELTQKTFTGLAAAEYRLVDSDAGSFDVLAGARMWWVDTKLDFSGQVFNASGSDSEFWVDPMVGAKGRLNLSEDVFLTSWGMIGGFGVSSELTWDVMGGLGYTPADWVSLIAGYRALSVDYKDDGFVFDVVMKGPIIGATFRF